MKKLVIAGVVTGFILGGAAWLAEAKEKPLSVFANFGLILNGFVIPNDLTLGLQLDLRLNKLLTLSPEFNVWSNRYRFSGTTLAPGAVANLTLGHFFIGGGFVFMRGGGYGGFGSDGYPRWAARPKANLGVRYGHFKLALGAVPIEDGVAGALTAGLGF